MDEIIQSEIISFIERTKSIVIGAVNKDGIPILKGVTKLGNDGMDILYFCTSPASEFYTWYLSNPKTSVYMFDDDPNTPYPSADEKYYALSMIGSMEAVTDQNTKQRFFSDYLSGFYPDGVDDKNYHLVRFVSERGKYYRGVTDNFLSIDFAVTAEN